MKYDKCGVNCKQYCKHIMLSQWLMYIMMTTFSVFIPFLWIFLDEHLRIWRFWGSSWLTEWRYSLSWRRISLAHAHCRMFISLSNTFLLLENRGISYLKHILNENCDFLSHEAMKQIYNLNPYFLYTLQI